jgi:hypothetical protein
MLAQGAAQNLLSLGRRGAWRGMCVIGREGSSRDVEPARLNALLPYGAEPMGRFDAARSRKAAAASRQLG